MISEKWSTRNKEKCLLPPLWNWHRIPCYFNTWFNAFNCKINIWNLKHRISDSALVFNLMASTFPWAAKTANFSDLSFCWILNWKIDINRKESNNVSQFWYQNRSLIRTMLCFHIPKNQNQHHHTLMVEHLKIICRQQWYFRFALDTSWLFKEYQRFMYSNGISDENWIFNHEFSVLLGKH